MTTECEYCGTHASATGGLRMAADRRHDAVERLCILAPTLARRAIAAEMLAEAMRDIANGTKGNPAFADVVKELARIDLIAMETLAAWEAAQ